MRIQINNPKESGGRQGWTKRITAVDKGKVNGYAFEGEFLQSDTEVEIPIGAILVQKLPAGSVKHGWNEAAAYKLGEDGELIDLAPRKVYNWRKDFLSFRDLVADAIGQTETNPLAEYSDNVILAEAQRRNLL